eukprot:PhF_6_TR25649/c0_g1_i2/m.36098
MDRPYEEASSLSLPSSLSGSPIQHGQYYNTQNNEEDGDEERVSPRDRNPTATDIVALTKLINTATNRIRSDKSGKAQQPRNSQSDLQKRVDALTTQNAALLRRLAEVSAQYHIATELLAKTQLSTQFGGGQGSSSRGNSMPPSRRGSPQQAQPEYHVDPRGDMRQSAAPSSRGTSPPTSRPQYQQQQPSTARSSPSQPPATLLVNPWQRGVVTPQHQHQPPQQYHPYAPPPPRQQQDPPQLPQQQQPPSRSSSRPQQQPVRPSSVGPTRRGPSVGSKPRDQSPFTESHLGDVGVRARIERCFAPRPTLDQMGAVVDVMVKELKSSLRQDGVVLPLRRVGHCVYLLGDKKLNLSISGGRLVVKAGGGDWDILEYLTKKKLHRT